MPDPTPTHRLADMALGGSGSLASFVAERRTASVSWRRISNDLREATGIDVTHETLRSWFSDDVLEAAS